MDSPLVFFSFVTLHDAGPEEHRAYNEWHQLDHRPENLALPGVAWGDRWALPAAYRDQTDASEAHRGTDYVAMYWFRDPIDEALREWTQLGTDSFQWGRGPLIPGVERTMLGFFRPVKGYAAPSALVSADVLPYRPNQGLHLSLVRYDDPVGSDTHEHYAWSDRVEIPALLDLDGVAGAWTFSFAFHQRHSDLPLATGDDDAPGSLRLRLLYLDGDPQATTARIEERTAALATSEPAVRAETLLRTPLKTIVPWQDW
ncbi:hypothetical protein [Nocardioides sp.]|uniref:hypothetical protein n=1 Tax=Nocardioides sp. TaxID=35761 RepID=UPI00261FE24C|nr:hypothetical protein [Nocardioides sp.]